eukprot:gene38284-44414_t
MVFRKTTTCHYDDMCKEGEIVTLIANDGHSKVQCKWPGATADGGPPPSPPPAAADKADAAAAAMAAAMPHVAPPPPPPAPPVPPAPDPLQDTVRTDPLEATVA